MSTRYGTCYFKSLSDAVMYYSHQDIDRHEVMKKYHAGEIQIGEPTPKPGQRVVLNMSEGRYFIEECETLPCECAPHTCWEHHKAANQYCKRKAG